MPVTNSNNVRADELIPRFADLHIDVPELPATALAAVLNFMPYDEVHRCLLAGKTFAADAAKHVQTLNITEATQMDALAAHRLQNVEEVNIHCLFAHIDNDESRLSLSPDATSRIVPFLTIFPRLRKVFIGGPSYRCHIDGTLYARSYFGVRCEEPANCKALCCGLVDAFCNAFKMGSLPDSLVSLDGIKYLFCFTSNDEHDDDDSSQSCVRCRDICTNFPIDFVVKTDLGYNRYICLSDFERYKIVREHRGGVECLQNANTEILLTILRSYGDYRCVSRYSEDGYALILKVEEMKVMPISCRGIRVLFMTSGNFAHLDAFILEFGLNPKDVTKENLYPLSDWHPFLSELDPYVWTKSTFDGLVGRGFALDTKDVVVDERIEPALWEFLL